MKRNFFFAMCLAGLLVPAALILCAADGLPAPIQGRILILKNDRTLQGDIVESQGGYLVRREVGELWLPAAQVKRLCASWEEALQVMRSQLNLHDPDERLKLAKWCQQNSLYAQAIEETKQALQMRPKHAGIQDYLNYLEHAAAMAERKPTPSAAKKDLPALPALDLSADSLSLFVTKVQPILMNTCAQCHANNQGGGFKLMRTSGIGATWQRATQVNMAAAVQYINLENPELSLLLIKANSKHGNAVRAPLSSRDAPPYQTLKYWIQSTIAHNPHLRQELVAQPPQPAPVSPAAFAAQPSKPPLPTFQPGAAPGFLPDLGPDVQPIQTSTPADPADMHPVEARILPSQAPEPGKTNVVPAYFTAPAAPVKNMPTSVVPDEYDPLHFNRIAHPGKK